MADDDVPDFDFDGALDWFYVEDDYPLADELAETQIPDPGYAGTKCDLDMEEFYDFDVFDYWDDLTYGDDPYWDHDPRTGAPPLGQKRKRGPAGGGSGSGSSGAPSKARGNKRRKLSLEDDDGSGDIVVFVDSETRNSLVRKERPAKKDVRPYALFPDWRERFANVHGIVGKQEMPAEMKRAAEAGPEETPPKRGAARGTVVSVEEEGDDDNGDYDDDMDGEDVQAELASLDPDMLKSILRQRLGDAGLEGMDEEAFMQAISKMLSGEEGGEDAAGNLADNLLNQATQGDDSALSGWLEQHGVSLGDADEGEDDVDHEGTPALSETAARSSTRQNIHSSPSDSVIEASKVTNGITAELALHGSSPAVLTRKRAGSPAEGDSLHARKLKKPSFDLPNPSNSMPTKPERETSKSTTTTAATTGDNGAPSSENANNVDESHVAKAKSTNMEAVKRNKTKTADSAAKSSTEPVEQIADDEIAADVDDGRSEAMAQATSARQTRKRKGGVNDHDDDLEASKPKKQAKKVSGPAEAVGKRTRSTRSATKIGR